MMQAILEIMSMLLGAAAIGIFFTYRFWKGKYEELDKIRLRLDEELKELKGLVKGIMERVEGLEGMNKQVDSINESLGGLKVRVEKLEKDIMSSKPSQQQPGLTSLKERLRKDKTALKKEQPEEKAGLVKDSLVKPTLPDTEDKEKPGKEKPQEKTRAKPKPVRAKKQVTQTKAPSGQVKEASGEEQPPTEDQTKAEKPKTEKKKTPVAKAPIEEPKVEEKIGAEEKPGEEKKTKAPVRKRRKKLSKSYYKQIDKKRYKAETIKVAEELIKKSKDGVISMEDAEVLFLTISDGHVYTQTEKNTIQYLRENYEWGPGSDELFRKRVRSWAAKGYKPEDATD